MVRKILLGLLGASFLSCPTYAAFIETAVGNAVVFDATAIYFNPGALSLVPNPQFVGTEGYALLRNYFNGTVIQNNPTHYTQTGRASSKTRYTLPGFYYAVPYNQRITFGFGGLYTFAGISQYPTNSIVRYLQTYSSISTYDLILAMSYRINKIFSVGAGVDFERASLTLDSEVGSPPLGLTDVLSHNQATDTSVGGHAGILVTPWLGTLMGLTYHSAVSYNLAGSSTFQSNPELVSNDFKTKLLTPSSIVFSFNQFVSPTLGFIATVQRMNWSVLRNLNLRNVILKVGPATVIRPSTILPAYLHDAWRYVLGANYKASAHWSFRASGAYDQDPTNPLAGFSNGTNIILSAGAGYQFSKQVILDLTYAHVFYKKVYIDFSTTSQVSGSTGGSRDFAGVKLTVNLV